MCSSDLAITNITTQINVLSSLPVQPLVPIVSNYLATEGLGGEGLKQRVKSALQLNGVVSLGMGVILFSFAPMLLSFLVGKGLTDESVTLFRTATVIYSLYSLNAVGYYLLFGLNQVAVCMKINLLSGLFSLLLIYLGTMNFGILGAIVGNIGYLGSLYLATTGLGKVNISMASWLQWLYVPLLWFATALIMSIFIKSDFILTTLFCTLQCMLLSAWYFKSSGMTISRFTARNRV